MTPLPSDGQTDQTSKTEKPVSWPSGAGLTHTGEEETLSTMHLQQWKALRELMAASIREIDQQIVMKEPAQYVCHPGVGHTFFEGC